MRDFYFFKLIMYPCNKIPTNTDAEGKRIDPKEKQLWITFGHVSELLDWNQKDYYLENPPKQPKNEIANYVEQNWILVPKRFPNLEEALKFVENWWEIIIRSEGPHENLISWLTASYKVNNEIIARWKKICEEEWKNINFQYNHYAKYQILWQIDTMTQTEFEENLKKLSQFQINLHCKLMKIDISEFMKGISYSYWEKIRWYNRTVIADSAIKWRYHIFTNEDWDNSFWSYLIIENGEVVLYDSASPDNIELAWNIDIVSFYEKIRNLDSFDRQDCPFIEMQTGYDGKNYFLQYHQTRQEWLSNFTLERDLEQWEFEAVFVRWATPKDWVIVETILAYPRNFFDIELTEEEASFDMITNFPFKEIMSRKRIVNFEIDNNYFFAKSAIWHINKSRIFKPGIFVLLPEEFMKLIDQKVGKLWRTAKIPIRVISDWKKAYVKLIE